MTTDHYILGGIAIGMFLIVLYVIIFTVLEKDDDE